jgi:hypothetical protein
VREEPGTGFSVLGSVSAQQRLVQHESGMLERGHGRRVHAEKVRRASLHLILLKYKNKKFKIEWLLNMF